MREMKSYERGEGWLRVAVFGLVLVFFGCANSKIELTAENTGKIEKTRLISVIAQEEITGEVKESQSAAAMGGGLLFALVDVAVNSSRSKEMEEQITPLKAALTNYDFREVFTERLKSEAGNSSILKISEVVSSAVPLPEQKQKEVLNSIPENALLTLSTDYKFSADFRSLVITSVARLTIKGQSGPIYLETYTYKSPDLQSQETEAAIAEWTADDNAKFRQASEEGIQAILSQLREKLLKT